MQNRFNENGESYRIIAGSNVASSIDPVTGKMFSAGHAFCRASTGDEDITIGYSSGSKVWSSKYATIPEYIKWCDTLGRKINDDSIVVKTNTNYDFIPMPSHIAEYPKDRIAFCLFSSKSYSSPPVITRDGILEPFVLVDASLTLHEVKTTSIKVKIDVEGSSDIITCYPNGNVEDGSNPIIVRDGRDTTNLANYLIDHPLEFKTIDDAVIIGNEVCSGNPEAIVFQPENIHVIDWRASNTDISVEDGKCKSGMVSIHDTIHTLLITLSKNDDFILYDHGSGEIADYIVVQTTDSELRVNLFHIKAMKGSNFNSSLIDIYEVCQQSVKSTVWLKSRSYLLDKVRSRKKTGHSTMLKGSFSELESAFKKPRLFIGIMTIVQPAISKSTGMPSKFQEVLAAAYYYIRQSGRIKTLEIWGSA